MKGALAVLVIYFGLFTKDYARVDSSAEKTSKTVVIRRNEERYRRMLLS